MRDEIETWWHLQQLMTRYANACDGRNWLEYRAVFLPGARVDYTGAYGRAGTLDEIVPWLEQIMDTAVLPSSQHLLANLSFEHDADRATGSVQYFNPDVIVENGLRRALINGGIYEFEAQRERGTWKLASLKARLLWSTRAELATFEPRP